MDFRMRRMKTFFYMEGCSRWLIKSFKIHLWRLWHGGKVLQALLGDGNGPAALEFLRMDRVLLLSSKEMDGVKQVLST